MFGKDASFWAILSVSVGVFNLALFALNRYLSRKYVSPEGLQKQIDKLEGEKEAIERENRRLRTDLRASFERIRALKIELKAAEQVPEITLEYDLRKEDEDV